jgi:hypothetical protein
MVKIAKYLAGIFFVLTFVVFPLLYFGVRYYAGYSKGFNEADMDWNQDGQTSIFEVIEASDVGLREIERDGLMCREYYAFKDALPIKVICP